MRKTEEEILREIFKTDNPEWIDNNENIVPDIITAMQTFAQQESEAKAVGFRDWCRIHEADYNNDPLTPAYTTAQLYAIYLKNKF